MREWELILKNMNVNGSSVREALKVLHIGQYNTHESKNFLDSGSADKEMNVRNTQVESRCFKLSNKTIAIRRFAVCSENLRELGGYHASALHHRASEIVVSDVTTNFGAE